MPPAFNGAVRRRAAANNGPNMTTLQQQQPQLQSKPWFMGAPVTKILCILWAAGSLWVIRSDNTDSEIGDYSRRSYDTNSLVFQNTSELIVGLSFLAHFLRRLEQELSSRRLVAWFLLLGTVNIFIRLVAMATMDEESVSSFVASTSIKGPYLFVGGVLYWYKAFVPRLYPRFLSSTTLNISCSEKTFPYVWALYVLLMRGTAGLLVGLIGFFGSALYFFLLLVSTKNTNGVISIPFLDVPDVVFNLLPWDSLGNFFFLDESPRVYAPFISRADINPRPRRQPRDRDRGRAVAVAEAPVAVAVPVPTPEAIAQLTSMGFEEQRVKEALQVSDNNVERAANILLSGS